MRKWFVVARIESRTIGPYCLTVYREFFTNVIGQYVARRSTNNSNMRCAYRSTGNFYCRRCRLAWVGRKFRKGEDNHVTTAVGIEKQSDKFFDAILCFDKLWLPQDPPAIQFHPVLCNDISDKARNRSVESRIVSMGNTLQTTSK